MTATLHRCASLEEANTLRLPCEAAALWEFDQDSELPEILAWCRAEALRPLPLGEGSNLLLPPRLNAAVLRCTDRSVQLSDAGASLVQLRVGAGKNWHELVRDCLQSGFHGLENLALIPGSTGAAPVQNIGAYGVEVSERILAVSGVDLLSGAALEIPLSECGFAYRDSRFKQDLAGRFMITAVSFQLSRNSETSSTYPALARRLAEDGLSGMAITPQAVFDAVVALRSERLPDPVRLPNAGSFFKNPLVARADAEALVQRFPGLPCYAVDEHSSKLSAAWMIEHCGFKGVRHGTAGVSPQHALVLVNYHGSRESLLQLAAQIQDQVEETFGCRLELEPSVISGD